MDSKMGHWGITIPEPASITIGASNRPFWFFSFFELTQYGWA